MEWIKKNMPILLSKTFWGYTLSAVAKFAALHNWIPEADMDIVAEWLFTVTTVNVIWKGANKVAGK
jgi:hypothetical protein